MDLKAQKIDESWLWHFWLGHFNFYSIKILHQKKGSHLLKRGYLWGLCSSKASSTTVRQRDCLKNKSSTPISLYRHMWTNELLLLIIGIWFSSLMIIQEYWGGIRDKNQKLFSLSKSLKLLSKNEIAAI